MRWGTCEFGCPAGAKASFDLIYLPQALKAGARLMTGARVRKITSGRDGRVTGAAWIDRDGREHHTRVRAVVVCANGVGTARLLLLSASSVHPDGLANSSGLVGRNLMLHPTSSVTGYYPDDLESWLGPAGELIHSMEFYETRPELSHVRGAKLVAMPTPGPLNALEMQRDRPFDELWGPAFHDVVARHGRGILWAAISEDLPDEANRVTLSESLVDADGVPAPKIDYRLSENNRTLLRYVNDRLEEVHGVMGATEVVRHEVWIDQPGHMLGTARMGDDELRSVVDPDGRAHDVPNLLVARRQPVRHLGRGQPDLDHHGARPQGRPRAGRQRAVRTARAATRRALTAPAGACGRHSRSAMPLAGVAASVPAGARLFLVSHDEDGRRG